MKQVLVYILISYKISLLLLFELLPILLTEMARLT